MIKKAWKLIQRMIKGLIIGCVIFFSGLLLLLYLTEPENKTAIERAELIADARAKGAAEHPLVFAKHLMDQAKSQRVAQNNTVATSGFPAASPFSSEPLYKEFDHLALTATAEEVLKTVKKNFDQNPTSVHIILAWLRDNSLYHPFLNKPPTMFNTLYFVVYSDILYNVALSYKNAGKEREYQELATEALQSLYVFEIIAGIDAERCKDISIMPAFFKMLGFRYKGLEPIYRLTPEEKMEALWTIALTIEKKLEQRPPNIEICSNGAAHMADLVKQPGTQTKEVSDPNYMGGGKNRAHCTRGI